MEGFFPQIEGYLTRPLLELKAYFILIPEYLVPGSVVRECYITQGLLDCSDCEEIKQISPGHIRMGKSDGSKVNCHYNAWVCFLKRF